jgi:hypothetical protein
MALQPTASKTDLLLNCQWPFDPEREIPERANVPEGTRYGSAFHQIMEVAPLERGQKIPNLGGLVAVTRKKWDLDEGVGQELAEHVRGSLPVLQKWLSGKNAWDHDFSKANTFTEKSFAISVDDGEEGIGIRTIRRPREEDHVYEDLGEGDIGATTDLLVEEETALVLDYKTGNDEQFAFPHRHPQMRTLSLIPRAAPVVAIFHADRRGLPVIYAEEIADSARHLHVRRLRKALRKVSDGSLRPGPWCTHCPAKTICPTQTAAVLQGAAALFDEGTLKLARIDRNSLTKAADVGWLHQFFAEVDHLKALARPHMLAFVKASLGKEIVSRLDGKVLIVRKRTEERLSKKAIVDALGVKEAERLFDKLRKAGALTETESEGVWAVFPD